MSKWQPGKGGSESNRRRSQRVILSISISVRTEPGRGDDSFEETTQTLLVNAHGALILLGHAVEKGQKLLITNCSTHAEQACQVAYLNPSPGGKSHVGVEFTSPSRDFWCIAFPPEDWVSTDQEAVTRKRE